MNLKHIPNILSAIRILLVGLFIYVFFFVDMYIAMVIFLVAGATDVVDGYLARRNNWITDLGKILDPLADKLMQFTVMICLCIKSFIPIWFVITFFLKDLTSLFLGFLVIKKRSIVIVSKWYGKMTVCLFYATILLSIFIADTLKSTPWLVFVVFLPAVISAIVTFIAYVKHYAVLKNKNMIPTNIEKKAEAADAAENN